MPAAGVDSATDGVPTARGQSEVVGMVLLIAVAVVVAMLVGWALLSAADPADRPVLNLNASVGANNVTLEHHGGEALPVDSVTVILRHGTVVRRPLGAFSGVGDGRFDPGDVARHSHTAVDTLRVIVVHEPSNTVVFDRPYDVPPGGTPTPVPNQAPTAVIDVSPSAPTTAADVTLSASGSSDSDGTITTYAWNLDADGAIERTGESVTISDPAPGSHTVTVRVTDDDGATAPATTTVQVQDASGPSVSNFAVTNPSGRDVQVTFDANESLATITVAISGPETATLDGTAFTETSSGGTYTYTAVYTSGTDGTYTATLTSAEDAAGNDGATGQADAVVVDTTPPSITGATLRDDGDENVTSGDTVTIAANVTDAISGVDSVTADATTLDAGTVTLTDPDGDGRYTATTTVGPSPTEGSQSVTITAADNASNTASAMTNALTVDTTPPAINTFDVVDQGSSNWFFGWIEQYEVTWTVDDPNLVTTTVSGNRDGTSLGSVTGPSGTANVGPLLGAYSTQYTFKIVAVDEAGNRACRVVTDPSDGTSPADSAYGPC